MPVNADTKLLRISLRHEYETHFQNKIDFTFTFAFVHCEHSFTLTRCDLFSTCSVVDCVIEASIALTPH